MTRQHLIDALADLSHKTYVRQAAIAQQKYRASFPAAVNDEDKRRATDIVERLEQLGIEPDQANRPPITREELVDELAAVSHGSWIGSKQDIERYYRRDATQAADHDLERAEDVVERLDELGIVSWDS